jgi:hypothetical protein
MDLSFTRSSKIQAAIAFFDGAHRLDVGGGSLPVLGLSEQRTHEGGFRWYKTVSSR